MKIKRFQARTFSEALELVKKELGDNAIVLSTEEKRGIIPSVEVVAAIDYDDPSSGYLLSQVGSKRPIVQEKDEFHHTSGITQILSEISVLRTTIQELKKQGYELSLPENKREIFNYLRERAIRDEFSLRLCEKVKSREEVLRQIAMELKIRRPLFNKRALMLVGPTGAGKTTTIAKLAWIAMKQGRRVALLSLDTYRIGAMEQIRIYARIMGIPLQIVSNELSSLISDVQKFSAGGFNLEIQLLISSNSDDASIQKPISYITTGQVVPDDIRFPDQRELASLILIFIFHRDTTYSIF